MAIDNKFERVDRPDHPDRCQAVAGNTQCPYKRIEGSEYCAMHAGPKQVSVNKEKSIRMYRLAMWQARIGDFADHPEVKSLREEIGILRLLMETIFDQCKDATNILIYSGKISDLVMKVEKVVSSCHRLEASTGLLLDKSAALQLASVIVEIMSRYVTDQDIIDQVATEILTAIANQKPDLKVEKRSK